MQQQEQRLPSLAELQNQLQQLSLQRAALKDQIEQIERQLPVLHGMIQVMVAQQKAAEEATED